MLALDQLATHFLGHRQDPSTTQVRADQLAGHWRFLLNLLSANGHGNLNLRARYN
jgi:hypothetical protein